MLFKLFFSIDYHLIGMGIKFGNFWWFFFMSCLWFGTSGKKKGWIHGWGITIGIQWHLFSCVLNLEAKSMLWDVKQWKGGMYVWAFN
jgi:hypothetical protein